MLKIYVFVVLLWFVLLVLAVWLRKKRIGKVLRNLAFIVFVLFSFEIAALFGFRLQLNYWLFKGPKNPNVRLFEPDPYTICQPIKGVQEHEFGNVYTHNSQGFRGDEIGEKKKFRIIAVGGSTTYCIGVDDHETWPYYLDSLLGPDVEVLNFGIPGHSTVEHLIQATFQLPQYQPDLILLLCGLNDIRNEHVTDLEPDYSNFHAPTLYDALGLNEKNFDYKLASIKLLNILGRKWGLIPKYPYENRNYSGTESKDIDSAALKLYSNNLLTFNNLMKSRGLDVVYIPQVMIDEKVEDGSYQWWVPYVPPAEFIHHLDAYNNALEQTAQIDSNVFVSSVLNYPWKKEDYVDQSHLVPEANLVFAREIAKAIKERYFKE